MQENVSYSINEIKSGNRIEIIDFLRGGAMLLVLWQHSCCVGSDFILSFHMPLFFIMSGLVLYWTGNNKQIHFFQNVKKQFQRVLVPYFIFEIVNLALSIILTKFFHYSIDYSKAIVSIITCINTDKYQGISLRLWFLPCIFFCNIIVNCLLDKTNSKKALVKNIVWMFVFFTMSYLTTCLKMRLPFTLDIAMIAVAFMFMGYIIAPIIKRELEKPSFISAILVCVGVVIVYFVTKFNSPLLMYENLYGNFHLMIIAAVAGSLVYFIPVTCLYKTLLNLKWGGIVKKYINWLGVNSVCFFPIHLELLVFVTKALRIIGMNYSMFRFLLVAAFAVPVINVFIRVFPAVNGISPKAKNIVKY